MGLGSMRKLLQSPMVISVTYVPADTAATFELHLPPFPVNCCDYWNL
jgi:hypothetical protein